jgi:DNA polymerase-4/protein ImuB
MKILCVLLPHFRLNCEIMRHPGLQNQPAVVFSGSSSRRSVLDFSPGLEGLRPEMSLEQAVALHGISSF